MKRLVFVTILLLCTISSCTIIPETGAGVLDSQETPGIAQAVFPLHPGTCWTYDGTVKWTEGDTVSEKTIRWQMEVLQIVVRGEITGYRMKGHPRELAWYNEGQEPGEYGILRVGSNKFYYASLESFQRLLNEQDDLGALVSDENLFLELPLREGKRFCETEQILREDGMYCWIIGKGEPLQMKNVAGLTMPAPLVEYPVLRATLPDRMEVGFTPGVGITNFYYVHHGTAAEVKLELSGFEIHQK
jgi:hypothetical protein